MKVSTPYQTILTADSVGDAREWLIGLEAFRRHLQAMSPMDSRMLEPMTIVVFRNEKTYRAAALPYEKEDIFTFSASRFVRRDGRFFAAVNPGREEAGRYSVFLQSSIWLTSSYHWPLPLWLETGLEYIYAENSTSGGRMQIGGPVDGSAQSLARGLHMPLPQMLGMTTTSATYQAKDGHFNAEAWAFVHFLMFGEKGANRPRLVQFMEAIQRGDDLAECEKLLAPAGMFELGRRFSRYVDYGVYRHETVPVDLAAIGEEVKVAAASELEVQLALGYLCLHLQGELAATPHFDRAVEIAPHDIATLEALAERANLRNDELERDRDYAEAVQAGSKFYLAHYYNFLPAVQAMFGSEAAADGTDPAEARKAVDGIKGMLRLRPAFLAGHETLAGLAGSLHEVNDDDRALLQEGAKLFPAEAVMQAGLAAHEISARKLVAAQARLVAIRSGQWEHADRIRNYTDKLVDRLESANNYYWLERFYAAGDLANAEKVLAKPGPLRLLPRERARYQVVRSALGARELLTLAGEALGRKDRGVANSLLVQVERMELPAEMEKEAARLRAELGGLR
ncbi:MAG: hypothetical protein JWM88_1943 [Verrucomicrobia bacterium]|nr:hypothetical protein [Verrucomicrobiota bacterium]